MPVILINPQPSSQTRSTGPHHELEGFILLRFFHHCSWQTSSQPVGWSGMLQEERCSSGGHFRTCSS